jgi:hypothetical protein
MKLRWAIALGIVAAAITLGLVVSVGIGHGDGAFRILTFINYLGITKDHNSLASSLTQDASCPCQRRLFFSMSFSFSRAVYSGFLLVRLSIC